MTSAEPVVEEKEPDDDAPWPEERRQACAAAVDRQYGGYVLSPDVLPNTMIMNRMDRNWRNKSAELTQLTKMKTWSEHALILAKPPKEEQLTGTAGGAGGGA